MYGSLRAALFFLLPGCSEYSIKATSGDSAVTQDSGPSLNLPTIGMCDAIQNMQAQDPVTACPIVTQTGQHGTIGDLAEGCIVF